MASPVHRGMDRHPKLRRRRTPRRRRSPTVPLSHPEPGSPRSRRASSARSAAEPATDVGSFPAPEGLETQTRIAREDKAVDSDVRRSQRPAQWSGCCHAFTLPARCVIEQIEVSLGHEGVRIWSSLVPPCGLPGEANGLGLNNRNSGLSHPASRGVDSRCAHRAGSAWSNSGLTGGSRFGAGLRPGRCDGRCGPVRRGSPHAAAGPDRLPRRSCFSLAPIRSGGPGRAGGSVTDIGPGRQLSRAGRMGRLEAFRPAKSGFRDSRQTRKQPAKYEPDDGNRRRAGKSQEISRYFFCSWPKGLRREDAPLRR